MVKIRLGQKVRDVVTGYTGIAVSATEFLQGCRRIGVQTLVKEDGSIPDEYGFDEPCLEVVSSGISAFVARMNPKTKEPPGGPHGISINPRRG